MRPLSVFYPLLGRRTYIVRLDLVAEQNTKQITLFRRFAILYVVIIGHFLIYKLQSENI